MATPTINPGELALAQIGISPILKGNMPEIGIMRMREMAEIPAKITRLANKVTLGSLVYTPYEHEHSYAALLERLSRATTAADMQDMVGKFQSEASNIATAFTIVVQEAMRALKDVFPVSVYKTFAGPKNIEPQRDKVGAFLNLLDVVNDPLRVFPLIASGALLRSQAAIVRLVYPTLSEAINAALYEATAKRRGVSTDSKPYQLPPKAEIGTSAWFNAPTKTLRSPMRASAPLNAPKSKLPQIDETSAQKASAATRNL